MSATVGELSTTRPESVKVFQRHGIDFCCGGGVTLAQACSTRGVSPAAVLAEIAAEEARAVTPATRWDLVPLGQVLNHILDRYHVPLKEDLPRLEAMARRVVQVHGHKDDALEELLDCVLALRADLEPHLMKEEEILFPFICALAAAEANGTGAPPNMFGTVMNPIRMMEAEHQSAGNELELVRALTGDFTVPGDGCATYRVCFEELAAFDRDLRTHIHLENNILFPKALELEATVMGVARRATA